MTSASAKIPNGATRRTQPTTTIIASATALNRPSARFARERSIRVSAKPRTNAKITIGTTAPCATEATTFTGIIVRIASTTDGAGDAGAAGTLARKPAATSGDSENIASIGGTIK